MPQRATEVDAARMGATAASTTARGRGATTPPVRMRQEATDLDSLASVTYWFLIHEVMHVSDDPLSMTFAALADPTRRAILARLTTGDASVMDLAEPFDMSLPAISKHLKVLERAGLVSRSKDAQRRPRRLEPRPLKQVAEWLGTYREFWEASFSRLDDYLEELQTKEKTRGRKQTRNHRRTR
jgi:DNA-binding transcriptional ArsR family regulator